MIGIIPAAGSATRMGGIPKMLLPIPGGFLLKQHIDMMLKPQATRVFVGANPDNLNVLQMCTPYYAPDALTNTWVGTVKSYVTMADTVLSIYEMLSDWGSSIRRTEILFGMPDTYFDDNQAFVKLAAALDDGADVAVGLFHVRQSQRHKLGMCAFDPRTQQILQVIDKSHTTTLAWAWGVLAWKPTFWQFIRAEDPHVGYALPRAIDAGLDVRAVRMEGEYFDCGTPDEYFECIEHLRRQTR